MVSNEDERRRMHQQNRRSWNAVTPAHNSHKRNQASFLREGGSTLFPDELELLGDLGGRRLAHLQCNCGQDSLSLVSLGAQVTGVDISDQAVDFSRRLSRESGLEARFERSDVLDWLEGTEDRFDVAFASYGTIGWLCDLGRWARGVHRILVPGGRLVLLEFHPLVWSLGSEGLTGDHYFLSEALLEKGGVNDYVGKELAPSGFEEGITEFENPEEGYSFQWTVADILQNLIDAGFRLEQFREYPYSNGCEIFEGMRTLPGNRFGMAEGQPSLPLMVGLSARRS